MRTQSAEEKPDREEVPAAFPDGFYPDSDGKSGFMIKTYSKPPSDEDLARVKALPWNQDEFATSPSRKRHSNHLRQMKRDRQKHRARSAPKQGESVMQAIRRGNEENDFFPETRIVFKTPHGREGPATVMEMLGDGSVSPINVPEKKKDRTNVPEKKNASDKMASSDKIPSSEELEGQPLRRLSASITYADDTPATSASARPHWTKQARHEMHAVAHRDRNSTSEPSPVEEEDEEAKVSPAREADSDANCMEATPASSVSAEPGLSTSSNTTAKRFAARKARCTWVFRF